MFRTINAFFNDVANSINNITATDVKDAAVATAKVAAVAGTAVVAGAVLEKKYGVGTVVLDAAATGASKVADFFGSASNTLQS